MSGADAHFIGVGQPACRENAELRYRKYRSYYAQLSNLGLWFDERYKVRKVAAAGGEWALVHQREIMPVCVVKKVRGLYPNPPGVSYVGHKWGDR